MVSIYGYIRTSTVDQEHGIEAQRSAIMAVHPDAEIFEEHASGKAGSGRPQLEAALARVCQEHAILVVTKLDRLGRSVREVLATVDRIERCGGTLEILALGVDTSTPNGRFMLTIFAAFAELERELISQRTREGLAEARVAGKQLGGPRSAGVRLDGSPSVPKEGRSRNRGRRSTAAELTVRRDIERFLGEHLKVSQVARLAGCSESLVRKVIAERNTEEQVVPVN